MWKWVTKKKCSLFCSLSRRKRKENFENCNRRRRVARAKKRRLEEMKERDAEIAALKVKIGIELRSEHMWKKYVRNSI